MAGSKNPRVQYRCSFCGKSQEQVQRLIAGPGGVYICNECIDLCDEIIREETTAQPKPGTAGPTSQPGAPPMSHEEHLRQTVYSGTQLVHRYAATRDYEKAITETEALLRHVRELHDLVSTGSERPDPTEE